MVSQDGLGSPGFNQRPPHIQLINGREKPVLLTRSGITTPPQEAAK
jgi:hypothetical protein